MNNMRWYRLQTTMLFLRSLDCLEINYGNHFSYGFAGVFVDAYNDGVFDV